MTSDYNRNEEPPRIAAMHPLGRPDVSGAAPAERLTLLDGMRGYFLALMMSQHLVFTGDSWFRRVHHGELAFVEDAQGFVFLSGLVVGLVYSKTLARQGVTVLGLKARKRVGELYRMMLLTVGVLVAASLAFPPLADAWRGHLGPLVDGSPAHLISVALMTFQPAFGDVLPQYMLYLALTPLLIRWTARGHAGTVLLYSLAVWFVAQIGLHHIVGDALVSLSTGIPGGDASLVRAYFNPLGWQLLFVVGLVLGADVVHAEAAGRPSLVARLLRPRPAVFAVALSVVVLLAVLRVLHGLGWIGDVSGPLADNFYRLFRRQDLSLVYAVNFAALAYVVAALLTGKGRVGRALRALWGWRFVVFLGQHSLQVYAFHVLVVFAVIAVDQRFGPLHPLVQAVLGVGAVASLAGAAAWHNLRVRWQARRGD